MTNRKRISGIAFHCHHDKLVEWVHDYQERVEYIKNSKPLAEQELRLRLFKLIPGDRLPLGLDKAIAALDKANAAWRKAIAARRKANTWDKAIAALDKANAAWEKAYAAEAPYFEQLHKELCPDCPWDGKTIFPKKEG